MGNAAARRQKSPQDPAQQHLCNANKFAYLVEIDKGPSLNGKRPMAKYKSYDDDDEDDFLSEEIEDFDDEDEEEQDEADDSDDAEESADTGESSDEPGEEEEDEPRGNDRRRKQESDEDAAAEEEVSEAEEEVEEEEEEISYPPDDEKAVAALKKLRVRLDVTDKGNVWRAIFDDTNGKETSLVLLRGLPALKEVWLLGTKVPPAAADELRQQRPALKVYR
jgi:hypothetical protein